MRRIEAARPVVLVTRATSRLGGRSLRQLRDGGYFAVRAMSRTPDSPAARALADEGVDVVRGDLTDLDALRRAMAGCCAVTGHVYVLEGDEAGGQALNLVDAAADAGVGRVVLGVLNGAEVAVGMTGVADAAGAAAAAGAAGVADKLAALEAYARAVGVHLHALRLGGGTRLQDAKAMANALQCCRQ